MTTQLELLDGVTFRLVSCRACREKYFIAGGLHACDAEFFCPICGKRKGRPLPEGFMLSIQEGAQLSGRLLAATVAPIPYVPTVKKEPHRQPIVVVVTKPDPAPAGSEGSPPGFSRSREPPIGGRPAERASGGPRPIDSAMWDFISGAERMRLAGKSEDHARRIAALAVEGVYLDA